MTNFEKIKAAKSAEELARFFETSVTNCQLCAYWKTDKCDFEAESGAENIPCIKGIKEWLEQGCDI